MDGMDFETTTKSFKSGTWASRTNERDDQRIDP